MQQREGKREYTHTYNIHTQYPHRERGGVTQGRSSAIGCSAKGEEEMQQAAGWF